MSQSAIEGLSAPAISGLDVDKLFGHYTYRLRPQEDDRTHQLLLLYGDNGSGKSTLSQLLFHALSRENGRGHRTFLAQTKFESFSIHFNTGASLTAVRDSHQLEGPFTLIGSDGKGNEHQVHVSTSEDGAVKGKDLSDTDLEAVLNACFPVVQGVYYLSDNRVLQSDAFDEEPSEDWLAHRGRIVTRNFGDSVEHMLVPSRRRDLTVGPSVHRAETWLRRQAINASNEGELTTSNIYTDIVRRISQAQPELSQESEDRLSGVLQTLGTLSERAKDFSSFGLSQPIAIESLTQHVDESTPDRRELVASVLEPYVNSIQSRLDAFAVLTCPQGRYQLSS